MTLVLLVNQPDYAAQQLQAKVMDHIAQRLGSDRPRERSGGPPTESEISAFISAARATCDAIERVDAADLKALLPPLTGLLHAAESLRPRHIEVKDTELRITDVEPDFLERLTDDINFCVVFDPQNSDSVVRTTLKDCLSDIYASLKGGLRTLDRSSQEKLEVIWELRSEYEFHWGRHLIDAIRFLMLS